MHLSKHHGLGNDFLVVLDERTRDRSTSRPSWPAGCVIGTGASGPMGCCTAPDPVLDDRAGCRHRR